jgi:hypothetical protein
MKRESDQKRRLAMPRTNAKNALIQLDITLVGFIATFTILGTMLANVA